MEHIGTARIFEWPNEEERGMRKRRERGGYLKGTGISQMEGGGGRRGYALRSLRQRHGKPKQTLEKVRHKRKSKGEGGERRGKSGQMGQ
jgi:hypothetical protein